MTMENDYRTIDFSGFSKVRESLKDKLHEVRAQKAGRVELSWDELDYAAAAGGMQVKNDGIKADSGEED